jgi:LemA protein
VSELVAFAIVLFALIAVWFAGAYDGLAALSNQTRNALRQVDMQLRRRHELIPDLVHAAQGAMPLEGKALEAVIDARNEAVKLSAASGLRNVAKVIAAEAQLSAALRTLMAIAETRSDPRTAVDIRLLWEQVTSADGRIGAARQLYNDSATEYNTRQQRFPTGIVARFARSRRAELWDAPPGNFRPS